MLTLFLFHWLLSSTHPIESKDLKGAWSFTGTDETKATMILTENHFAIAYFKSEPAEFLYTEGGSWSLDDDHVTFNWEFHTKNSELIMQSKKSPISMKGDKLIIADSKWMRSDDGLPGKLEGAWVITGRKREGKMLTMTPGVRRTMKILSGTKFQWIAYNVETKQFMGTGGGSYTSVNGKYIENIEFFSRDNSRVGASLDFHFDLKEGKWHHSGMSSKGQPIYEIWSTRQEVGI